MVRVTARSSGRHHQSPTPENRRIARAAGLVSGLTLLSRIGGLVRDTVVGYYFGAGVAADAFFVAFRLPNLLRRFVAEGAMNVAFIPVFSDYVTRRSAAETERAARALATVMAIVLVVLTLAGIMWAPALTTVFAPGFVAEPAKFALTVSLTRRVFPYLFLIGMASLCGGVLNAYRHFAAPALSPIFLNLAIIGAAVVIAPRLDEPVCALAYGVVAGGVLQVAVQLPPLLRRGVRLWPRWEPGHPAVRRVLWLMGPTVFGAAIYQITIVINTVLASALPGGSVSYLWYATRVFEFPVGLFAVAISTAALPSFSSQAARGLYGELADSVSFSIRLTNWIAVPGTIGLICLAHPIVAVLFERGAFGARDASLTASALAMFAIGLWPLSIARILVPAFYALHESHTPVITAAAALVANIGASVMLMGVVPTATESGLVAVLAEVTKHLALVDLRHAGLALASSLAALVNMLLLALVMRRRLSGMRLKPLVVSLVQSSVASAAMVWPMMQMSQRIDWSTPGESALKAGVLLVTIGVGVGVFALAAAVIARDEIKQLMHVVAPRSRARRP